MKEEPAVRAKLAKEANVASMAAGAAAAPAPAAPPAMKREAFAAAAPAPAAADAQAIDEPTRELEAIAKLRAENRAEEADKALAEFRRKRPDYRIPEAMWERVKPRYRMASEMRRMAKLLMERREEAFRSRYPREESMRRVDAALEGFQSKGMVYATAWRSDAGATFLDVRFAPSRSTRAFLNTSSLVFLVLLGATAFALLAPGEPMAGRVLLAIGTLTAILVFPFVVVAFGSRREAEEATLRRRLKKAIVDED